MPPLPFALQPLSSFELKVMGFVSAYMCAGDLVFAVQSCKLL
jgi:hypothetical protein